MNQVVSLVQVVSLAFPFPLAHCALLPIAVKISHK